MSRLLLLPASLAVCFSATFVLSQGQSVTPKTRAVPSAVAPAPFPADSSSRLTAAPSLEFRPVDQLSPSDRLLAADAESSVAERARLNGLGLEDGKWTTLQIVCPALPNHLFLQYTRNNGDRDVTRFSASIPRNGAGRVRIIPILKRGYSLFSPAPVNAMTISAFNHIRAEEGEVWGSQGPNGPSFLSGAEDSWVGNALCYAALAGAHPQIASVDAEPALNQPVPAITAQLEIEARGGEVIRFADAAARPYPTLWTMTFNSKGKLIKATHLRAPLFTAKPLTETSPVVATRQVPAPN